VRSSWETIPTGVRERIDAIAGARVVTAQNLQGGFSPGPAARCTLEDGRTVFVKAAGLDLNPHSPAMHRREGEVLADFAETTPSPRLIGMVDDGDWVALVIEWIDGHMPVAPHDAIDVDRILRLVARLAATEGADGLLPCLQVHPEIAGHWGTLLTHPTDGLDAWSLAHLAELAELERDVGEATCGDRLVHMDLRSDNIIFATAGEEHDVAVDWPGASVGAAWIDLVGLLPALELDGGPTPDEVFGRHPLGRAADAEAVTIYVAAMAGYFTRMSLMPPPPGLPTLRSFQRAQGTIARRWLGERMGWPPVAS
jgi:hypothetical protein